MKKKLIAGNWKMNGSLIGSQQLLKEMLPALREIRCDVAIFPPAPYLLPVASLLQGTSVALGAQNVAEYKSGAYTGEVSAEMLVDVGASYVLIGHSERRALFGDVEAVLARKLEVSLLAGLTPIYCVGETLQERQANKEIEVVRCQLFLLFEVAKKLGVSKLHVAYEPVWAIGTGLVATSEQAQAMHASIRASIAESFGAEFFSCLLYGGSVKPDSAAELLSMDDVDGLLVGGASLSALDFVAICQAAI